jgi:hypothetical protein
MRLSASLSFACLVGSGGVGVHELEADVGQVERLAGVGEVDCCVHLGMCVCIGRRTSGIDELRQERRRVQ